MYAIANIDGELIVLRRATDVAVDPRPPKQDLIAWADEYLRAAERHPAGTTDAYLVAERGR